MSATLLHMNNEHTLTRTAKTLISGGVCVLPTDTVYGIGVSALGGNVGAVYSVKKRDANKPVPWLIPEAGWMQRYAKDVPDYAYKLAGAFWPGGLTLVVQATDNVPKDLCSEAGTIALRVPDCDFVRELARIVGGPLAVSSANLQGHPAAVCGKDIEPEVADRVDFIIDGGPARVGEASTIVACTGLKPVILREGAIDSKTIREVVTGG